jgi:hypothetical protein
VSIYLDYLATNLTIRYTGGFERMREFAAPNNARLVLISLRGYPGSDPYTDSERAQLASARTAAGEEAVMLLQSFMRDRAREVFDFLGAFIQQEQVPPAREHSGGVIFCTWSFGTHWMMGLLANVASFPMGDTDLTKYVRRTVLYGEFHSHRSLRRENHDLPQDVNTEQIHQVTQWVTLPRRIRTSRCQMIRSHRQIGRKCLAGGCLVITITAPPRKH